MGVGSVLAIIADLVRSNFVASAGQLGESVKKGTQLGHGDFIAAVDFLVERFAGLGRPIAPGKVQSLRLSV